MPVHLEYGFKELRRQIVKGQGIPPTVHPACAHRENTLAETHTALALLNATSRMTLSAEDIKTVPKYILKYKPSFPHIFCAEKAPPRLVLE